MRATRRHHIPEGSILHCRLRENIEANHHIRRSNGLSTLTPQLTPDTTMEIRLQEALFFRCEVQPRCEPRRLRTSCLGDGGDMLRNVGS
jgi:hypothetical protein